MYLIIQLFQSITSSSDYQILKDPVGNLREDLQANGLNTCFIKWESSSRILRCWGSNEFGQNEVPRPLQDAGRVAVGNLFVIATNINGKLFCWGMLNHDICKFASNQIFGRNTHYIRAGDEHWCGIDNNHTIHCFGNNDFGQTDVDETQKSKTVTLDAGASHTCLLHGEVMDNKLECFGDEMQGQTEVPLTQSTKLEMVGCGKAHTCVMKMGKIHCWGDGSKGQLAIGIDGIVNIPRMQIAIGYDHNCYLNIKSKLQCVGNVEAGKVNVPQEDLWSTVAVGQVHTCGLTPNKGIICWGNNKFGQLDFQTQVETKKNNNKKK